LILEGEIGFGRPCVGIVTEGSYLEYDDSAPIGKGAYHKGNYLAVLVGGECATRDEAVMALYEWCIKLKEAGYGKCTVTPSGEMIRDPIELMLGRHLAKKLVRV